MILQKSFEFADLLLKKLKFIIRISVLKTYSVTLHNLGSL